MIGYFFVLSGNVGGFWRGVLSALNDPGVAVWIYISSIPVWSGRDELQALPPPVNRFNVVSVCGKSALAIFYVRFTQAILSHLGQIMPSSLRARNAVLRHASPTNYYLFNSYDIHQAPSLPNSFVQSSLRLMSS